MIHDALYPPITVNNLVYDVSGYEPGKLSVIDPRLNQEIKTLTICDYPWRPVVRNRFLYIFGNCFNSLIIDTDQKQRMIKKRKR